MRVWPRLYKGLSKDFLHLLTADIKVAGPNLNSKILLYKLQFFKDKKLTFEQELEINFWIEFFHLNFLDNLNFLENHLSKGFCSVIFIMIDFQVF